MWVFGVFVIFVGVLIWFDVFCVIMLSLIDLGYRIVKVRYDVCFFILGEGLVSIVLGRVLGGLV